MVFLTNYDFLEDLVKDGNPFDEPFIKDGICIANRDYIPTAAYVFKFEKDCIWAVYGWTKYKNKAFLKFHKEVEKIMLSFNLPILRVGKYNDFKNHAVSVGELDGHTVYQYVKKVN